MPHRRHTIAVTASKHPIWQLAIRALLVRHRVNVIGEANSQNHTLLLSNTFSPDIFLIDANIAIHDNIPIEELLRHLPGNIPKIIFSESHDNNCDALNTQLGVSAWINKRAEPHEIIKAIRYALAKHRHLGSGLA